MNIIANIFGFFFLIAAGLNIISVESIELGEYSSRFIATLLGISAYYGLILFGGMFPELPIVKFELLVYLVPSLGVAGLVYFGNKIFENRSTEIETLMKGSRNVALIIVYAILARFLLAQ